MPARATQRKTKKQNDSSESDRETLDLDVSDASSIGDGDQAPVSPVTTTLPVPPTLAPLLPSAPTGHANCAHDIDYFFTRGSRNDGSLTICKQCK